MRLQDVFLSFGMNEDRDSPRLGPGTQATATVASVHPAGDGNQCVSGKPAGGEIRRGQRGREAFKALLSRGGVQLTALCAARRQLREKHGGGKRGHRANRIWLCLPRLHAGWWGRQRDLVMPAPDQESGLFLAQLGDAPCALHRVPFPLWRQSPALPKRGHTLPSFPTREV